MKQSATDSKLGSVDSTTRSHEDVLYQDSRGGRRILDTSSRVVLKTRPMSNAHKVALITGASSGIGEACARRFARADYHLVLAARRVERLTALARELSVPCHVARVDVTDPRQIIDVVENLPESFANVDVLINNAGLALGLGPAQSASLEDWDTMIDTNVRGLVHCTRAVLPKMVTQDRGHIVNVGSIAGTYPYPGGNAYGATKAFVHQFSLNLRADLLGTRLRVTCIVPGMVSDTEFSAVRFHGDSEKASAVYQGVRALRPEDVAEAIDYVVSCPPHVNVNVLELMPVDQAFGPFAVNRHS
jgi:3-hydroxy acid dehydrogenase / malonic semialdehyde reductase